MPSTVLILNPRSGGGLRQPALRQAALRRDIVIRDVDHGADATALAAAADADVLAVGGGDGTVSAVAAVAVARGLPLLVLACGTRNHFASDAGVDVADPDAALSAVDHGRERRVDVGSVNGRVFLNNVSLGFYSSMIQDPQYRAQRAAVTGRYLRRAVLGASRPLEVALAVEPRVTLPQRVLTILVSNNSYSPGIAPGAALRPRLDEGMLWIHVLGIRSRGPVGVRLVRTAVELLTGRTQVAAWPAASHTLEIDRTRVTLGVDGEPVEVSGPLELVSQRGALRLLVPRGHPEHRRRITIAT